MSDVSWRDRVEALPAPVDLEPKPVWAAVSDVVMLGREPVSGVDAPVAVSMVQV